MLPDFFFCSLFPVQQTTSGIGHREVGFFGSAANTLNVRNNNNNNTGGQTSKRLGGIIGCKNKTFSWHLNRFPDGGNLGSTVQCRGEAPPLYCTLTLIAMQGY